ncbi:hypothetical protein HAALTHF_12460n [Vreelandella aquamarina]|nr:hypothetical protein HAALTHF_12460n [Halomonas axialensis]
MLEVNDLRVSYGQSEVIHGINLAMNQDETLAVMGRNGMGKTTLFKALMGVLPSGEGSICLEGQELIGLPAHKRVAAGLAYVPQGRMIFPNLTVMENIESGLETAKSRKVPREIFDLFPVLLDMRNRKVTSLAVSSSNLPSPGHWLPSPRYCCLMSLPKVFSPQSSKRLRGRLMRFAR